MFQSLEKSQPKLVYAHAGHSDTNREEDSIVGSTSRSLVTESYKDEYKKQEPVTLKSQQKEIQTQIYQSQQLQQKENQNVQQSEDRHELSQGQLKQPTQIDVGYISLKKTTKVSGVSFEKENLQTIPIEANNLDNIVSNQPTLLYNRNIHSPSVVQSNSPSILNKNKTFPAERTIIYQTNRSRNDDIASNEKFHVVEKVEQRSMSSAAPDTKISTSMSTSVPLKDHHVFSISSKVNHDILPEQPGSNSKDISALKHGYVHSRVLSNNEQINQQHRLYQQEQHHLKKQQEETIRDSAEKVHETRLHVTDIKVNSNPLERQDILPVITKSDTTEKSSTKSNISTFSLHQFQPTPLSSSKKHVGLSKLKFSQSSEQLHATSTSTPKSILKNSTSFEHGDLPLNTPHLPSHGTHNETIPEFDYKDKLSTKRSVSIVKQQIEDHIFGRTNSAPHKSKKQVTPDNDIPNIELNKETITPKKSVTFHSEVRLHLDDELSTVATLPVNT